MKKNLYSILRTETIEDGIQASVCIHANHPILQGHFPAQPIFPGVCSMDMVLSIWNLHSSRENKISKILRMKFIQPITIQYFDTLTVRIHAIVKQETHLKAEIQNEKITFFTMEAELVEDVS